MKKILSYSYSQKVLFFVELIFKKIFLLFTLFFLFFFHAIQPKPTPQSIEQRLKELKTSYYNQTLNTDSIISLAISCYKDSKLIHYNDGIRRSGICLQIFYYNKGDVEKSIKISNEIEALVEKSYSDYLNNTKFYLVRAGSYTYLGFFTESEQEYQKALKMAEKIPDNDEKYYQLATIYSGFSLYYSENPQYSEDKKLFSLLKALQACELISKDGNLAKDGTRDEQIISLNYFLGDAYMTADEPNMEMARKYFIKAQEVYATSENKMTAENEIRFLSVLCSFYYTDKNYNKAIEIGQKALSMRKGSTPDDIRNIYQFIFKSYLALGNEQESKKYMNLYFSLNDSINRNTKSSINRSAESIISKKEKDGSKKNTYIIYIACSGLIILSIITFIFWKRNNRKLHNNYDELIKKLEGNKQIKSLNITPDSDEQVKDKSPLHIPIEKEKVLIKKIEKFEKSHGFLRKDLTLTSLANSLNTNPKYLSEIIKTHRSKSFNNYINGLRIHYITNKLYEDHIYREYKIVYLSEECGYSSSQVFVIAFKKENGVTPSYYISQLKKTQDTDE